MSEHAVMEPPVSEPEVLLQSVPPAPRRNPIRGVLGDIAGVIPTLLVLAAAGGIGWWGHHNGWKLPKFSELNGAVKEKDDWCAEHNVPESICVECDPTLMPADKSYGWCKVHGVPECTLDHPNLAQLPNTPVITQADLDRAARALAFTPRPTNNPNCRTHLRRIQYVSAAAADKSGIAVEPVWTAPAVEFVSAPGEIGYDQTRLAHLSARSPGTVWKVFKHLGQPVKAGDVLALVEAAEVGRTGRYFRAGVLALDGNGEPVAIEDVCLGRRMTAWLAGEPGYADSLATPDAAIDPATWRAVWLAREEDGVTLTVGLLRPLGWLTKRRVGGRPPEGGGGRRALGRQRAKGVGDGRRHLTHLDRQLPNGGFQLRRHPLCRRRPPRFGEPHGGRRQTTPDNPVVSSDQRRHLVHGPRLRPVERFPSNRGRPLSEHFDLFFDRCSRQDGRFEGNDGQEWRRCGRVYEHGC